MRELTPAVMAKIKQWEGCRLNSYKDSAGVWTIGYGHTSDARYKVGPGQTITQEYAERLLRADLGEAMAVVQSSVTMPLTDEQFGALVSFTYNIGTSAFRKSTLLKKLNAGDYGAVPAELAKWNKAGGKVLPGLSNRRAAEAGLWAAQSFVASASVPAAAPSGFKTPEAAAALVTASAGLLTAANGSGPLSWALAAAIVIAAAAGGIYAIRRARA